MDLKADLPWKEWYETKRIQTPEFRHAFASEEKEKGKSRKETVNMKLVEMEYRTQNDS